MSYIKDFQESDDLLKSFVVSLFNTPLWYLSFYFLNNSFFNKIDILTLIVICSVLSATSSILLSIGLQEIIIKTRPKIENEEFSNKTVIFTAGATIILWAWNCVLIFTAYSFKFLKNDSIYMYYYIIIFFTPIILLFLISLMIKQKIK